MRAIHFVKIANIVGHAALAVAGIVVTVVSLALLNGVPVSTLIAAL